MKPCGKTFLDSHILKNHIHTYNSWIPHYFMIDISQNISRIKLFQMMRKTSQYFNMKLFYTFKALKPPSSLVVDFVADKKDHRWLPVLCRSSIYSHSWSISITSKYKGRSRLDFAFSFVFSVVHASRRHFSLLRFTYKVKKSCNALHNVNSFGTIINLV